MKQHSPLLSDYLSHIYSSEQQLHELIPTALRNVKDDQLSTAFGDLLEYTMNSSQRMGQVSTLLETRLERTTPESIRGLIEKIESQFASADTAAQQTELLELLHKFIGNLFTDYTYTMNLVSADDSGADRAISLLQQSLDELKDCNDRLSRIALDKITQTKVDVLSTGDSKGMESVDMSNPVARDSKPQVGLRGGRSERFGTESEEDANVGAEKSSDNGKKRGFRNRIRAAWSELVGK